MNETEKLDALNALQEKIVAKTAIIVTDKQRTEMFNLFLQLARASKRKRIKDVYECVETMNDWFLSQEFHKDVS